MAKCRFPIQLTMVGGILRPLLNYVQDFKGRSPLQSLKTRGICGWARTVNHFPCVPGSVKYHHANNSSHLSQLKGKNVNQLQEKNVIKLKKLIHFLQCDFQILVGPLTIPLMHCTKEFPFLDRQLLSVIFTKDERKFMHLYKC